MKMSTQPASYTYNHNGSGEADGIRAQRLLNVRYLREAACRSRRLADVADRGRGHRNWADSARTVVASGRTGVRAEAAFPLRARNWLYRPKRPYAKRSTRACASAISGISGVGAKPSSAGASAPCASTGRPVD